MLFSYIVKDYFRWHYKTAFHELFRLWFNFIWFFVHLFSIPTLLRSLFAPLRRITEERVTKWDFESIAGYVIINLFSRLLGAATRLTLILAGAGMILLVLAGGVLTFIGWIFAPVILLGLSVGGIGLIISNIPFVL